jgi:hypothetical protein
MLNAAAARVSMPSRLRTVLLGENLGVRSQPLPPRPPAPLPSPASARTIAKSSNRRYNELRQMCSSEDTMRMNFCAEIEAKRQMPPHPASIDAARARARQRQRRRTDGVSAAFAMATSTCQDVIECGGCGCWLMRGADLVDPTDMCSAVSLTDSATTICARKANVAIGEEEVYERQSHERWDFTKANVSCAKCGVFLGIKILSVTAVPSHRLGPFGTALADFEPRIGCYIKAPAEPWVREAVLSLTPPSDESAVFSEEEFETASEGDISPGTWLSSSASDSYSGSDMEDSERSSSNEEDNAWNAATHVRRGAAGASTTGMVFEQEALSGDEESESRSRRDRRRRGGVGCVSQSLRQVRCAFRDQVRRRRTVASDVPSTNPQGPQDPQESGAPVEAHRPPLPPLPPREWNESLESLELVVNQIHIGLRYVRLVEPHHGGRQKVPAGEIRCHALLKGSNQTRRRCGNVLSYSDQVLCTERCWGFRGDGPPEPSFYINSLREGSYTQANLGRMRLGQGTFGMMDVSCKECNTMVGYKFAEDCSRTGCNQNHVGRAGLVLSCVSLPVDDDE